MTENDKKDTIMAIINNDFMKAASICIQELINTGKIHNCTIDYHPPGGGFMYDLYTAYPPRK